jgi:polyisoprenoid-binding protein YceI
MNRGIAINGFAFVCLTAAAILGAIGCDSAPRNAPVGSQPVSSPAETAAHEPAPEPAAAEMAADTPAAIPEAASASVAYAIDPAASKIEWVGSKPSGTHRGGFQDFSGNIELANGDPAASSVNVAIMADSIRSDAGRLTGHLKSPEFFNVAGFPTVTFASTSIARQQADVYLITGDLSMHGVSKSISFPAQIHVGEGEIHASGRFELKQHDFGMTYTGKPDDAVVNGVAVQIEVVARPANP